MANSTCCANTAPEHAMMGKLVVDSLVTWARQYKVDGFRFDLMGHHPKANILAVRAALDRLTVARDGVDGKVDPALRRGLELRRGRRRRPFRPGHPGQHGRHRHRHLQRPAARRGARRRTVRRQPPGAGFRLGALHRPERRPRQRITGRAEGPAAARPRPDQGGAHRQPARLPVHRHRRAAGHRGAGGLQRLPGRLHGRAGGGRHLRRRARQRDPVRRVGVQAAAGHHGGGPLPDAGAGAGHGGAGTGHRVRHRRHRTAAVEVAGPQLVQLR